MAKKRSWYEPYGYEEEYEYVSRQTQYDDAFAKSESNDKKEFEDIDELFDIVANKLFASVTYDKTNNKLCFYSEKGDLIGSIKMDDIVPTEIIKDAYYDASTQELVIIFENDKEVRISLSDLVDIYEAGDGLEAVEKQDPSGNTTTYFQVKIDAESDEFLTVSEDGVKLSGVKNAIDAETARATAVEEELAAIASATTQGLDEEIARAKAAEAELQGAIDAEAERAQAAEETLTEAIADEADRAQAAEEALEASIESAVTQGIAAEVERAQAAEAELQDAIDAEVARATSAESALTEAVADEIARATEEEGVLAEAIDTESARIDGVAESLATETNRATSAETAIQNAINNEIERATAVEADLQEAIESALTKQVVESVVGSSSINVDDTDLSNPVLSAKVSQEVEDGKSNLIKINTDGLYAGVDLLYDDLTNTLTFKTTTASKDINLLSNSVIDRIYYNSADETIVIEYTVNGKKMPDVVVPVSDLITEIDVSSTTSVRMTKTVHSVSGTDYIYAEVILDNHDDNIAQIDNGLYVPGSQISANTEAIEELEEIIGSISGDTNSISNGAFGYYPPLDHNAYEGVNNDAYTYISGATNLNEADRFLSNGMDDLAEMINRLFRGSETYSAQIKAGGPYQDELGAKVRLAHSLEQVDGSGRTVDVEEGINHVVIPHASDILDNNLLRVIENDGSQPDWYTNGVYFNGAIDYGTFDANGNITFEN